jgi:hypothetical protein
MKIGQNEASSPPVTEKIIGRQHRRPYEQVPLVIDGVFGNSKFNADGKNSGDV